MILFKADGGKHRNRAKRTDETITKFPKHINKNNVVHKRKLIYYNYALYNKYSKTVFNIQRLPEQ